MNHLEELVIVAVVHMDADDHRSSSVKRRLHDRGDVVRLIDHESLGAECLGILDIVEATDVDPDVRPYFSCSWTATMLQQRHRRPAVPPQCLPPQSRQT